MTFQLSWDWSPTLHSIRWFQSLPNLLIPIEQRNIHEKSKNWYDWREWKWFFLIRVRIVTRIYIHGKTRLERTQKRMRIYTLARLDSRTVNGLEIESNGLLETGRTERNSNKTLWGKTGEKTATRRFVVIPREKTATRCLPRKLPKNFVTQLSSLRTAKSFGLVRVSTRCAAVAIVLIRRAFGGWSVVIVVRRWTRVGGRIVSSWKWWKERQNVRVQLSIVW